MNLVFPALGNLDKRQCEPEEMDDLALSVEKLHGALAGLSRINSISAIARIVWRPIVGLARRLKAPRLSVLDIATGAGDVPMTLWKRAKWAGLSLDIRGIDVNTRSVEFARQRAVEAAIPVEFT